MAVVARLLSGLVTASAVVGAVAVILMMLQIVADVLVRGLFNWRLPLTTIIVANYYMIVVAYLPIALAETLNRNISVEILFNRFSPRWQHVMAAGTFLFSGIVCAGITWELWMEASRKARTGAFIVEHSVSVPIWPSYFVLPIGFGLLALVLFYRFASTLSGKPDRLSTEPGTTHTSGQG